MPIPAATRRAAPPRRRKKPSAPPYKPPMEEEATITEEEVLVPESTSVLADAEAVKIEVSLDVNQKPVITKKQFPPAKSESPPEPVKDSILVTEKSTSQTFVKSGDPNHTPEGSGAPSPPKEDCRMPSLLWGDIVEPAREQQNELGERSGIDVLEQVPAKPFVEVTKNEDHTELDAAADGGAKSNVLIAEPDVAENKPKQQLEDQDDSADVTSLSLVNEDTLKGGREPQPEGML